MIQSEPTVFILNDDSSVLEGLYRLIKSVKLNAEIYTSARDFLDSCNPYRPGCLLIDIGSRNQFRAMAKNVYRENPNIYKGKT